MESYTDDKHCLDYVHVTSSQQSAMLLYSTLRLYKKQLEPHCHNIYMRFWSKKILRLTLVCEEFVVLFSSSPPSLAPLASHLRSLSPEHFCQSLFFMKLVNPRLTSLTSFSIHFVLKSSLLSTHLLRGGHRCQACWVVVPSRVVWCRTLLYFCLVGEACCCFCFLFLGPPAVNGVVGRLHLLGKGMVRALGQR